MPTHCTHCQKWGKDCKCSPDCKGCKDLLPQPVQPIRKQIKEILTEYESFMSSVQHAGYTREELDKKYTDQLLSLISKQVEEIITEGKPNGKVKHYKNPRESVFYREYKRGFNTGIDQYESNLLAQLKERMG